MNQSSNIVNITRGKPVMPSKNGYVMVWRDIKKQSWYRNPECLAVFMHIMLNATSNRMQYNHKGVDLMLLEGQFASTYQDIGDVFGFHESKVRRFITLFEKSGQLGKTLILQGRINKGIKLTFTNWNKWQKPLENTDRQTDRQSDRLKPTDLKVCEPYADTHTDRQADRVLNNNLINNNKDTCQKTKVFPRVPNDEIVSLFAEILPSLPQPKKLTAARKSTLKARHVNDLKSDLNNWRKYFEYVRDNCSWMVSGNFNITFDYLIKQSNLINILEGAKNDRA